MARIRALVVDDSSLVRKLVSEILSADPDIEVVGTAMDPYVARDKIVALDPDVITLDLEMPRMDGLTFLRVLMKHHPIPVVVMSSLTRTGSSQVLEALQSGAVEVIGKPGSSFSVADSSELVEKVKAAAQSRYRRRRTGDSGGVAVPASTAATGVDVPRAGGRGHSPDRALVLMGASTGGTEALKEVLTRLPTGLPGICVVQHIPGYFSGAFAERLNQLSAMEVREARSGDRVTPGLALVAPGGRHMVVRWAGTGHVVELNDGPPVHHQRPAVDVLFDSAVKAGSGASVLALLLTGMGADGAAGMLRLREAGAWTVAQDEASCVVFGMPREAIRMGAAREVVGLDRMAARVIRFGSQMSEAR